MKERKRERERKKERERKEKGKGKVPRSKKNKPRKMHTPRTKITPTLPAGLEPATFGLEVQRAIRLRHGSYTSDPEGGTLGYKVWFIFRVIFNGFN